MTLIIQNLQVEVEGKEIIRGVSMEIPEGEVHILMGPNGSGKSTLSMAIAGHPDYRITGGRIIFRGRDITRTPSDERSRAGLFFLFQHPPAVKGVRIREFLEQILEVRGVPSKKRLPIINSVVSRVCRTDVLNREIQTGFSGGEQKRLELAQMLILKPALGILDEPDSGVDVDSIRVIGNGIRELAEEGTGFLIITHSARILDFLEPHRVYIMNSGRIVKTGGKELVKIIESRGFNPAMDDTTPAPGRKTDVLKAVEAPDMGMNNMHEVV